VRGLSRCLVYSIWAMGDHPNLIDTSLESQFQPLSIRPAI